METLRGITEMHQKAEQLIASLHPQKSGATVIALSGDLGAGKTTFVQGIARALGITENITSPTFVIQKNYPLTHHNFKQLIHIDAYRLKNKDELMVLGWEEILADSENLICIEWPECVEGALPNNTRTIKLSFIDDLTRGFEQE